MTKKEAIEERIFWEERSFAVQSGKNRLKVQILKEALFKEIERERNEKIDAQVAEIAEALKRAGLVPENLPADTTLSDCKELRLTIAEGLLVNEDILIEGIS